MKCQRCHRIPSVPDGYDSCPDCVTRLAKSLAEEMRKVRVLEERIKWYRDRVS